MARSISGNSSSSSCQSSARARNRWSHLCASARESSNSQWRYPVLLAALPERKGTPAADGDCGIELDPPEPRDPCGHQPPPPGAASEPAAMDPIIRSTTSRNVLAPCGWMPWRSSQPTPIVSPASRLIRSVGTT